jgi:hypothetical protein
MHPSRISIARTQFAPLRTAHALVAIVAVLVALTLPGCAKDPVRPANPVYFGPRSFDAPRAWSRDGQWIAFSRLIPSSYGPPGIYVVHRTGAIVRCVYHGPIDVFFPSEVSFSPDGRFLSAVDFGRKLMIVNLATLEVRRPLYTQTEIYYTDWSPDGRSILYSQFPAGDPSTTNDSLGLFLFDVATGTRRVLRWGPLARADYARWSPDGSLIAMSELVGPIRALSVINADGTGHRIVIPPRSGKLYFDIDWYRRASGGAARIFFTSESAPYLINPDGTGRTPFWHRQEPGGGFLSPTGVEYVRRAPDPSSHEFVLYVGLIDDVTDVAVRQITRYEPLVLAASAQGRDVRHDAVGAKSLSIEQQPRP